MIPWYNSAFRYRKLLTVTAGSVNVPQGYVLKCVENTETLYNSGKCRSDYNDARIVYWDGSTYTPLYRDRANSASMLFSTQAAITASTSSTGYYLYYGCPSATVSYQPTTDETWLKAYAIWGETPDSNSKVIYLFDNGSGTTLTDRKGSNDGTIYYYDTTDYGGTSGYGWNDDGPMGRSLNFIGYYQDAPLMYVDCGAGSDWNGYNGLTVEAFTQPVNGPFCGGGGIIMKWEQGGHSDNQWYTWWGKYAEGAGPCSTRIGIRNTNGYEPGSGVDATEEYVDNWTWTAFAYDKTSRYLKTYVNGTLKKTNSAQNEITGEMNQPTQQAIIGKAIGDGTMSFRGRIGLIRFSNTPRTSFPYASCWASPPTISIGSEENYGKLFPNGGII